MLSNNPKTVTIGEDKNVLRLGFGAMRITGPGIWGAPENVKEAKAVLRRAVELGINFIDTADSYGPNVSEELIAETLHPYSRDLVIATKGGFQRTGHGQWVENGDPKYLRAACEASLKRLKVDVIDLYQLHRIDPKVEPQLQFEVMRDLRNEGKIKHVGLSEVGVADIKVAQEYVPIVSVQNRYSVSYRKADAVVDYCDENGIVFIPWRPIDGGGADGISRALENVAARHGATTVQIGIAWLLARSPWILPIPGTSSVKHLEENFAAGNISLSEADLRELEGR